MLELVVRGRIARIVEVPYRFSERFAGESKSSAREGLRYLRHLASLRSSVGVAARAASFGRSARRVCSPTCSRSRCSSTSLA